MCLWKRDNLNNNSHGSNNIQTYFNLINQLVKRKVPSPRKNPTHSEKFKPKLFVLPKDIHTRFNLKRFIFYSQLHIRICYLVG